MKAAAKLLKWYRRHGRSLPWRKTRNPYRILVSEIMLQQTQVDRVKDFYKRWFKQFPTWRALANASNAEVLHAWAGLGYNRRALVLRDIAKHIVEHGVPTTEEGWRALKGIGPYTASAVSAFAQKKRTMPIDTNTRRVLGRVLLGRPYPQPKNEKQILSRVDNFLPNRGHYYDVPQALFDLATDICTKVPACHRCPMRRDCKSAEKFLSGKVRIPKQMIKKARESRYRNKPYPNRIYRGRVLKEVRESSNGLGMLSIAKRIDPSFDPTLDTEWIKKLFHKLESESFLKKRGDRFFIG